MFTLTFILLSLIDYIVNIAKKIDIKKLLGNFFQLF
jgi:hypothetical protein